MLTTFRLQQKELAQLMGVDVDRVKSLVLSRAKSLRREEVNNLLHTLPIQRAWLEDGVGEAMTGEAYELRLGDGKVIASEPDAATYASPQRERVASQDVPLPPMSPGMKRASDATLLLRCVQATENELRQRRLELEHSRVMRLYWAVFEMSRQAGQVNVAAIGPLIELAAA
ncbi:hypothetical protein ACG04Q_11885 [Roseateles sp. DXS20W]|uniref:Uncharacterized protein n=1 Tax=Pelomonas lactea TaxID=3299030 RepID=A0ABW7GK27_9BURK